MEELKDLLKRRVLIRRIRASIETEVEVVSIRALTHERTTLYLIEAEGERLRVDDS